MRILIIGLNHQIQPTRIGSSSTSGALEAFEQAQKEKFGALLSAKIAEHDVKFVGEEAKHGQETVTQRCCDLERCRYANIEMTPEERLARKIPPDYEEDESMPRSEKSRFHLEREEYMFHATMKEAQVADSIIVVCGSFHTQPLARRFREAGHTVEEADIRAESWYVEDWLSHMLRL